MTGVLTVEFSRIQNIGIDVNKKAAINIAFLPNYRVGKWIEHLCKLVAYLLYINRYKLPGLNN
jgi:hypothetical protein